MERMGMGTRAAMRTWTAWSSRISATTRGRSVGIEEEKTRRSSDVFLALSVDDYVKQSRVFVDYLPLHLVDPSKFRQSKQLGCHHSARYRPKNIG